MTTPRLHHYVPQFYLRRFADAKGRLHVWDRSTDRVFVTGPRAVAAERDFYFLDDFERLGYDPMTMERQFAEIEDEVAIVTEQWLGWVRQGSEGNPIEIPAPNRELVSLYIALQFLRTADSRDVMAAIASQCAAEHPSIIERRLQHTQLLWDEELVHGLADRIAASIWVFGRNDTPTPFITSDNPVAFRTADNAMWLKVGVFSSGTYVVFPLAPTVVMYCYPAEAKWERTARFDSHVSPIQFTEGFVESENTAQVFMASRFVIGPHDGFVPMARAFAKTIGTDVYAPRPTPPPCV